jgi:microsomal dipeptidase-like Zn-dependent dipeptidase
MLQQRRIRLLACAAALSFLVCAGTADAQQARPLPARPVTAQPLQPTATPLPSRIAQPPWQFADIRLTVLGPNTVKIDWMPLPGADQYIVKRNDVQIGPVSPSSPNATQPMTTTDPNAPASSTLNYTVTALGPKSIAIRPGSVTTPPGSAAPTAATGEFPLQVSRVAQITTPVLAGPPPISGWVDLHAHLMGHLGFGGKLISGAPDAGSLLPTAPTNSGCVNWVRATGLADALGDDRGTAGGYDALHFTCGNDLRKNVIGVLQMANSEALVTAGLNSPPAMGFPAFNVWPAWNDITHQKMWWEWLRRARDGGQRVMVALAVNNHLLADALQTHASNWVYPPAPNIPPQQPGYAGDAPSDDLHSGDLQVEEIKAFVARHSDFMAVAHNSAELESIARSNRIAVVIGVELDDIGNLLALNNPQVPPNVQDAQKRQAIPAAIQHLYDEGVRYVLPIHVVDNLFGGTAVYETLFNLADLTESGHYWNLACANTVPDADFVDFQFNSYNISPAINQLIGLMSLHLAPPPSPTCGGHVNALGFDMNYGKLALVELMKRGMIIDIDHMSTKAVDQVLSIAEAVGYPINSGHSGLRGVGPPPHAENMRSASQLQRIAHLHGMFGLGSDGAIAANWLQQYQMAMSNMGPAYQPGAIGFGTDLNGVVKGPRRGHVVYGNGTNGTFSMAKSNVTMPGNVVFHDWDYNSAGVAHYGMLPEFIWEVHQLPPPPLPPGPLMPVAIPAMPGGAMVDSHLFRSADYFLHMWQTAEAQSRNVH